MNSEFRREQEELCIKYGVKKYADELFAEEIEAAKNSAPLDARRERRMARKVLGHRKQWRKVVLVAVLVAGLTVAGMSAGAFGGLWKWLSVQVSNTFIRFEDTAVAVYTEDGRQAEEVYAQLAAECPDVGMVIPKWVPEGTVLQDYESDSLRKEIELKYYFNRGYIWVLQQSSESYLQEGYPIERNEHDKKPIEVMGQQATYTDIQNELGEHVYAVSWKNEDTETIYNLRVTTDDLEIFKKVVNNLKNY